MAWPSSNSPSLTQTQAVFKLGISPCLFSDLLPTLFTGMQEKIQQLPMVGGSENLPWEKPVLDTRSSEPRAYAAQMTLQSNPLCQQDPSQVGTI